VAHNQNLNNTLAAERKHKPSGSLIVYQMLLFATCSDF
jgi:hypothetical protein